MESFCSLASPKIAEITISVGWVWWFYKLELELNSAQLELELGQNYELS